MKKFIKRNARIEQESGYKVSQLAKIPTLFSDW